MRSISKSLITTVLFGGITLGLTAAAHADLAVNGGFEQTSIGNGEFNSYTTVTGWSSSGYNFVYAPGTADTTGAYTPQFNANVTMWGLNNGGLDAITTSPDGGNFVAADGAYEQGAISQTINGLTAGAKYTIDFYVAAAQQNGFDGNTTEGWQVSLGSDTQSTDITTVASPLPSHGFSGWSSRSLTFTADGTSDVLSFLAYGTPNGEPPFSLLDGVDVEPVAAPEPSSLIGGGLVLLALGGSSLRMFRKQKQAYA
jgi:hypothetical protein